MKKTRRKNGTKRQQSSFHICDFLQMEKAQFVISLTKEAWATIYTTSKVYEDGKTYDIFKENWADVIFVAVKRLCPIKDLKCVYAGFRAKVYKKEPWYEISGYCMECANPIRGVGAENPNFYADRVEIRFETGLCTRDHSITTIRPLCGTRREQTGSNLIPMTAKQAKDTTAGKTLTDSGSGELYNSDILKVCRLEAINKAIGLDKFPKKPVEASAAIKLAFPSIHMKFSTTPFKVSYWSKNQTQLYRETQMYGAPITIDASGRFVFRVKIYKNHGTSYIFLYMAVIRINGKIYPIFQMLSDKHDGKAISGWLIEWLQSGAPPPKEVVVDCSLALLNAISNSFNSCSFKSYIDSCYQVLIKKKLEKIPSCFIRRDRNHLIVTLCRLDIFKKKENSSKKDFFVRCIGFLLEIDDILKFENIVIAIFTVCMSDWLEPNSNAFRSKQFLSDLVEDYDYKKAYKVDGEGNPLGKKDAKNEDLRQEQQDAYIKPLNINEDLPDKSEMYQYIEGLSAKALKLVYEDCANQANRNIDIQYINNYNLPKFMAYLKKLFAQVFYISA